MAKLLEYYSNVLSFCHWYFPGKFTNFLKQQKQPPEVFFKKGIFKNFAIFAKKHLCCSLLQTFRPLPSGLQLYQKETPTQVFYSKYSKFLRTPILKNIWERLIFKWCLDNCPLRKIATRSVVWFRVGGHFFSGEIVLEPSKKLAHVK